MKGKMKTLPTPVNEEDFFLIMKNTRKKKHKVAFLLGFGAGMRVSEVCNLQPQDIDFKEKSILIRQGKGKKDRIVPLPKGFKQEFLKLIPIKCKIRSLQWTFRDVCKRLGILKSKPNLSFHSLRHGFGSELAKKGMPIHHIRTLMGHSNISTTNVYLELNPREALKKYEEVF